MKTSARKKTFDPDFFSPPNLVPAPGEAASVSFQYPSGFVPKLVAVVPFERHGLQGQIAFGFDEIGGRVLGFGAGQARTIELGPELGQWRSARVLLQREPRGIYRARIRAERETFLWIDPADLAGAPVQPHQKAILAIEHFLANFARVTERDARLARVETCGPALKEHLDFFPGFVPSTPVSFSLYDRPPSPPPPNSDRFWPMAGRASVVLFCLGVAWLWNALTFEVRASNSAWLALEEGRYSEAAALFPKAIELNCFPGTPCTRLRILQARAYEALGKSDLERKTLELAFPYGIAKESERRPLMCDRQETYRSHALERYRALKP